MGSSAGAKNFYFEYAYEFKVETDEPMLNGSPFSICMHSTLKSKDG